MILATPQRFLHAWYTRRKNQRSIESLDAHLRSREPALLVHQMGRAGSMTTVNTLRAAGLTMPVFHTHWLNPASVNKRVDWVRAQPEQRHPLNVRTSVRIADEIQRLGPRHRNWHLVTVFREPVARNLSVFFLSIEAFIPDFFRRHRAGTLSHQDILDVFLERFPHDQPLRWFDEEVRDVFGIDVYQHAFPTDKGYQIIRDDGLALLLIKVETLNACYQDAFAEYLGLRIPELKQTHVTERDPTYSMYGDFIANVALPENYIDRMYRSKFATHYYTPGELATLRQRWLGSKPSGK